MGDYLNSTRYIIAELEIQPIYNEEGLHSEVCNFFKEKGFEQVICIRKWLTSEGTMVGIYKRRPRERRTILGGLQIIYLLTKG
ncbi:MAG: hypothetical protein O4861_15915 [Trichodesmium sp. St16_bin4-tuft]|nr:hypothetical protein [Trichodesmium sp. MAG_R01]MDE5068904.1 hypothetical protein [Trichodesmium sp. St4_bin8_1]MDE5072491.1 hypothetical protein [Trichodesmium sp. St5_bin8]MDE5077073.1 hypothetical protein [Trichodesmium sp. St2_bin6]MDE5099737.1 hypothetical protein [Trichodesmium sp. St16_bin4-tuft]MDE5102395.1 hypothetical protein [Trichodesmium sp. St19_bin2]